MSLEVLPASAADEPRLRALFQLYAYDFSELLGLDVQDDGRFGTPAFAAYLDGRDPRCHGFLLRVDQRWAGFALVQQRSRLSGDDSVYDMAEFFVLRRHRRHGVGERAAAFLFDRFRGRWEVREKLANVAAIAFWRRVIGRYSDGRFTEELIDDERWRGPVQRFDSSAR